MLRRCIIFDQETEEDFICYGWIQLCQELGSIPPSPCGGCICWGGSGRYAPHDDTSVEKVRAYGMHDEGKMQRERAAYYDGLLLAIMTTKKEIDNYPVG